MTHSITLDQADALNVQLRQRGLTPEHVDLLIRNQCLQYELMKVIRELKPPYESPIRQEEEVIDLIYDKNKYFGTKDAYVYFGKKDDKPCDIQLHARYRVVPAASEAHSYSFNHPHRNLLWMPALSIADMNEILPKKGWNGYFPLHHGTILYDKKRLRPWAEEKMQSGFRIFSTLPTEKDQLSSNGDWDIPTPAELVYFTLVHWLRSKTSILGKQRILTKIPYGASGTLEYSPMRFLGFSDDMESSLGIQFEHKDIIFDPKPKYLFVHRLTD